MCSFSRRAPCVMRWSSTKCWISFTARRVFGLIKPNVPYHSRPPVKKKVKLKIIRTLGFREVQLPLKYWFFPSIYRIETLWLSPPLGQVQSPNFQLEKKRRLLSWKACRPQCLQAFTSIGRPLSGFRRRYRNPFHWAFGISFGQAPNPPIRSIRSAGPM